MISDAEKIRSFWKPDNKLNRVNERYIRKAFRAADIDESSISYFLYLPEYESYHSKVVASLQQRGKL